METSTMIRQLRRTAKKHENDKLHTFDTDISLMCTDVANRLEKLEKEKQEIRARAIDEFAEKICIELTERSFEAMDELEFVMNVVSHDKMQEVVMEIAEQLKKAGAI